MKKYLILFFIIFSILSLVYIGGEGNTGQLGSISIIGTLSPISITFPQTITDNFKITFKTIQILIQQSNLKKMDISLLTTYQEGRCYGELLQHNLKLLVPWVEDLHQIAKTQKLV